MSEDPPNVSPMKLVCAACRYEMAGLSVGDAARCPECGHVGAPVLARKRRVTLRGVLTALVIVAGVPIVCLTVFASFVAFRLDWSLGDARALCAKAVGVGAVAVATAYFACFTGSGRRRHMRLGMAGVHAAAMAACAAFVFAGSVRVQPWNFVWAPIICMSYNALAIAALVGGRDVTRLQGVLSNRVARRAGLGVVAGAGAAVLGWASWYAVTVRSQVAAVRTLEASGAYVRWDGPRVVSLHAKLSAVDDACLGALVDLPHLRSIDLSQTVVTDAGMVHVAGVPGLMGLYIDETRVTDAGVKLLHGNTSLTWFSASETPLSDAAMPTIATFSSLRDLYLGDTDVSDAGLGAITGLGSLSYVNVPGTRVTSTGARSLEATIPGVKVWEGDGK